MISTSPAGTTPRLPTRGYRQRVNWHRAWGRLRHDAVDVVIVALAIASYVELAVTRASFNAWAIAPLAIFWAPPLLARRRFPLPAVLTSLAALTLAAALDGAGLQHLVVPFFCALAIAVVAGSLRDRTQLIVGAAATVATISIVVATDPSGSAGDFVWITLFFGAAWLGGRAIATRAEQARELRARVVEAERAHAVAAERAAAEERARIATELHDVVAHSVSVMVVQSSGVRRLLREDQHRERDALLSVEQIGRQALTEMRRMLGVMRTVEEPPPVALTPQPGLKHLEQLVSQVEAAGLPVTLRVEGERQELPLGVDLSAYRILQEGLTNALKHAPGSHVQVLVRFAKDTVQLEVSDDGDCSRSENGVGQGLVGMRERVALYGGTLEAGPRPDGGGFVVRAELPVEVTRA
jgi:signal transduction histidine kinase